ncbi:MAG: CBS domain-containing protein [Pseudomonadota bacterium]
MTFVREVLKTKGPHVWSVPPHASVLEAIELMAEKNLGAVLVMSDQKLVGIFSERDYARKVRLKGRSSPDTLVSELMTKDVIYVSPGDKINECMALMTYKRVRHLPVIENSEVIGIVTIGDVVKQIISDQQFIIKELEKYITGGY